MRYTAINIGPILATLSMARKPRELWSASYLFSYLMKRIMDYVPADCNFVSLSKYEGNDAPKGVGLYPDRVYVKGEFDFEVKRKDILINYAAEMGLTKKTITEMTDKDKDLAYEEVCGYINVMSAQINSEQSESQTIKSLNHILDCLELNNRSVQEKVRYRFLGLIQKSYHSSVLRGAFPKNDFKSTLAEIASIQLSAINQDDWNGCRRFSVFRDKNIPEEEQLVDEDAFYVSLKNKFETDIKSYHKYICVVQADGDNMGKTFSHEKLPDGKAKEISQALLNFDCQVSKKIREFGGLPIYAGGDDLLFIAPVVGMNNTSIFDLIKGIDSSFEKVKETVEGLKLKDKNGIISPSMSYGISISYYKYPLYEALKSAQHLLFDVAKEVDGKNAIAWNLRKSNGSSFSWEFNKGDLLKEFEGIIQNSDVKDTLVSAVSHKIRENEGLLSLWLGNEKYEDRNTHFFEQYLEYDSEKDKEKYKGAVLKLLNKLYSKWPREKVMALSDKELKERMDKLVGGIYGLLRTAKFIKGEEVIDE